MKRFILPVLVFCLVLGGLLWRNAAYDEVLFYDWDEGIYAQVSWELWENQTLQTTFNDTVWLNKPPLSHALIAVTFGLFGRSEFAARAVMIFFGMLLLVLTYLLTKKVLNTIYPEEMKRLGTHHRELVSLLPVLGLAATPLFIERSIVLNTDVMLGVSWVGFFLAASFVPKLLFLMFGVLSKSIVGFYPALVSLFMLKKKDFTLKNLWLGAILVIVPLVWHIISYVRFGDFFIQAHLFDQVVKRVVSPIELHFGGRLYYLELLWTNVSVLSILMVMAFAIAGLSLLQIIISQYRNSKRLSFLITYGVIVAIVGIFYLIPGPETALNVSVAAVGLLIIVIMHLFWKKTVAPDDPPSVSPLLIVLSPLPFFGLLMMSQSKIAWYLITLLPLMMIGLSYLYMTARYAFVRLTILGAVVGFFGISFLPQTYGFEVEDYQPDQRLTIAECMAPLDGAELGFLVSAQERQNRMVLEATQLQTATSFVYGGSPSFVYYAQKDVEFFYNVEGFVENYESFPIVTVSTGDRVELGETYTILQEDWSLVCETNDWEVYTRSQNEIQAN